MRHIRMLTLSQYLVLIFFLACNPAAYAENKDCWADLFEESNYGGKQLHLGGPVQLETLNKVNGEDWNEKIHSLKVGPQAKITLYKNPKFVLSLTEMAKSPEQMQALGITEKDIKEDSELIFNENAKIHDLGDFNFHKQTKSLKVECTNK